MPWAEGEPGMTGPRSQEEQLIKYKCAWPGCENSADHVVGCVRELAACVAFCREHAPTARPRSA